MKISRFPHLSTGEYFIPTISAAYEKEAKKNNYHTYLQTISTIV
jgi:hypothetical protein